MPSGFAGVEMQRPNFTGRESTEQKVSALENYVYLLMEYLRYALRNIGPENLNSAEVVRWLREEGVGMDEATEEEVTELVIRTILSRNVITENLYAEYGAIADLAVDRLRTDWKRADNYLRGDTGDLNYLDIHDEVIQFITAATDGAEAVQLSRDGKRFWWLDENRSAMTAAETEWPVMVYVYREAVKAQFAFQQDARTGYWVPRLDFGQGDERGYDRLRIRKGPSLAEILYRAAADREIGLTMGLEGYLDLYGLRRTLKMDFSGWEAGSFTETLEGDIPVLYGVTFDGAGRPVEIRQGTFSTRVVWDAEEDAAEPAGEGTG